MPRRYYSTRAGVEYIEIPKAGCTSIKWALLETDGEPPRDEWQAHLAKRWDGPPAGWRPRLVFTFVRHPLARLVSCWREKLQKNLARRLVGKCPLAPTAPFPEFAEWVCGQHPTTCDRHWAPQTEVLRRHQGEQPQAIFRLENAPAIWLQLQARFNLAALPARNTTTPKMAWQERYDAATLERVVDFYTADLDTFGYRDPRWKAG